MMVVSAGGEDDGPQLKLPYWPLVYFPDPVDSDRSFPPTWSEED